MNKNSKILRYWDQENVESMYDKNLLSAEIVLIKKNIPPGSKILDAGCGEGEGAKEYSFVKGVTVHAVDFSDTRLKKAAKRLKGRRNVTLKNVDFLGKYILDNDYDVIISQRFLINLPGWRAQMKVLKNLIKLLKSGGKLLILEGIMDGVNDLNKFRACYGLKPIPVKWHNYFFKDKLLVDFMSKNGCRLVKEDGFGAYFLLTRGIRPIFDKKLNWDCDFNSISSGKKISKLFGLGAKYSRLKLWVFQKQ